MCTVLLLAHVPPAVLSDFPTAYHRTTTAHVFLSVWFENREIAMPHCPGEGTRPPMKIEKAQLLNLRAYQTKETKLKEEVDVKVVDRIEPSALHLLGLGLGLGPARVRARARAKVEPVLEDIEDEREIFLRDGEQRPQAVEQYELRCDDDGEGEASLPDAGIEDLGLLGRLVRRGAREHVIKGGAPVPTEAASRESRDHGIGRVASQSRHRARDQPRSQAH
eukprot:scaffold57305_cov50-Phaeocystis_antarctica.AAC.2